MTTTVTMLRDVFHLGTLLAKGTTQALPDDVACQFAYEQRATLLGPDPRATNPPLPTPQETAAFRAMVSGDRIGHGERLRLWPITEEVPTVTVSALNSTTVPSGLSVTLANSDSRWTFFGARTMGTTSVYRYNNSSSSSQVNSIGGLPYFMEFGTDSQNFALRLNFDSGASVGLYLQMWVDGFPIAKYPQVVSAGNGKSIVQFQFATKRPRQITVRTAGMLHEAYFGPTDTVWTINRDRGPAFAVVGDSWSVGGRGGGSDAILSFVDWLGLMMGYEDIHYCGQSSTGWCSNGNVSDGSKNTYGARLPLETLNIPNLSALLFVGSINDEYISAGAATPAEVQAAATAALAQVPSSVRMAVVGTQHCHHPTTRVWRTANDVALQAACAANPAVLKFVPTYGMFGGSGRVGATSGSGNADLYIANDDTHPTVIAGHYYFAERVYNELGPLLRRVG